MMGEQGRRIYPMKIRAPAYITSNTRETIESRATKFGARVADWELMNEFRNFK